MAGFSYLNKKTVLKAYKSHLETMGEADDKTY